MISQCLIRQWLEGKSPPMAADAPWAQLLCTSTEGTAWRCATKPDPPEGTWDLPGIMHKGKEVRMCIGKHTQLTQQTNKHCYGVHNRWTWESHACHIPDSKTASWFTLKKLCAIGIRFNPTNQHLEVVANKVLQIYYHRIWYIWRDIWFRMTFHLLP